MFNGGNGASLADIAALLNNNDGGFGGNGGGWWALIIILALCGGFNGFGNAYGGGRGGEAYPYFVPTYGGGGGANPGYVLTSDFSMVDRKLDGIANGIASLGYDQLSRMCSLESNIAAGFNATNVATMQGINTLTAGITGIGTQLQQCCCENREAIAQVRYDMATGNCAITNAINQMGQQIIQNDNANWRALHDELAQIKMEQKDAQIADLTAKVNALNLAASQGAQSDYIINRVVSQMNKSCPCG